MTFTEGNEDMEAGPNEPSQQHGLGDVPDGVSTTRAPDQSRTGGLLLTMEPLFRLSYGGM